MTTNQWSDFRYLAEQRAYSDGEFDGYYDRAKTLVVMDNDLWQWYLKGYRSGMHDRMTDASIEACFAFAAEVAEAVKDGDR